MPQHYLSDETPTDDDASDYYPQAVDGIGCDTLPDEESMTEPYPALASGDHFAAIAYRVGKAFGL